MPELLKDEDKFLILSAVGSPETADRVIALLDAAGGGGGGGSGTVTSVALSVPASLLGVSGSPITTSGTLALSLANQASNLIFSGPATGADAAPTFRSLVVSDIPNLSTSILTSGLLSNARGGTGIDSSASTGIAKLSTGTWSFSTIVNTDINAAAAISYSKLAALTASRVLVSDVSGTVNASSVTSTTLGYLDIGSSLTSLLSAKAALANPSFAGSIIFGNYHVEPSYHAFGNSGAAKTLDLSLASSLSVVVNDAAPLLTLTSGQPGAAYMFLITQDGTGTTNGIPSFSPAINWGTIGAPTYSTAANKIDFVTVYTPDGTNFYGLSFIPGY